LIVRKRGGEWVVEVTGEKLGGMERGEGGGGGLDEM
jgi:hypothetical protein